MEVHGQLLEPRADTAELLQPADALLGNATASVRHAVETRRRIVAGVFVFLVRNHRLDLLPGQPVAHALHAVALVAGELPGLATTFAPLASAADQERDGLSDDRFGPCRFMDLPRSDFNGKRSARTVSDHVELRSKPAAAAAQCVVRWFFRGVFDSPAPAALRLARTFVPSMHHKSQSIRPSLFNFI